MPRIEISDYMLFLRYALPCAETLVKRGWVGRDVVELELENAAVSGERPKTDIRDVFPVAYARCSLLARQMGRDSIDGDVVRAYFWTQHDGVIEERHKEFGDFDKELCKVVAGKVTKATPLTVETAAGERGVENPYSIQVASGDHVILHYTRIIEKVSEEQAKNMLEGKAEEMFRGMMKDADGVVKAKAFMPSPGIIRVERPKRTTKEAEAAPDIGDGEKPKAETTKKPRKTKRDGLGIMLALMAACVSGVSIFANKIFIVDLDPALFTAVRALIIGLLFLAISAASGSLKPKRTQWTWLILIGVIGGGLAFLMFFTGLKLTTGGRAAILQKTLPLWVVALAVPLLKERIGRRHALAMLLMFAGAMAIVVSPVQAAALWADPSVGDALVLGATLIWAAENVAARKLMRDGASNLMVSFARMFFGALFLFGVIGLTGKAGAILALTATQLTNLMISTGLLFVYVFLYYWSLKHTDVSKASTALLLAPVITLALGVQFLGEPIQTIQIAGSAAILVGGVLIARIGGGFRDG